MLKISICVQMFIAFSVPFSGSPTLAQGLARPLKAYVFIGPDCPISQDYVGVINTLAKEYADRVQFIGVVPGVRAASQLESFRREFQATFEIVADDAYKLVDQFSVGHTPEVVLLDASGEVQYQGAIDNWYYELGRHRMQATAFYLTDAIEACSQAKPVMIKTTRVVGCPIAKTDHHRKKADKAVLVH